MKTKGCLELLKRVANRCISTEADGIISSLKAENEKLLAVVEAAKSAKKGQYRGLCADRLDEAIETLDD